MPDKNDQARIIYIHGFNSSPESGKAQLFSAYLSSLKGINADLHMPALPYDPRDAIKLLEKLVTEVEQCFLVGSSLGGYYATYLAEKYGHKAALINPAVSPTKNVSAGFLGMHTNYHTGEEYELTMTHVDFLSTLDIEVLKYPSNYLLLVQTGDQVCDYRLAVARYAKSSKIVQEGGDHSFVGFSEVLPDIFKFSELLSSSNINSDTTDN